jgi:hypothetical protein
LPKRSESVALGPEFTSVPKCSDGLSKPRVGVSTARLQADCKLRIAICNSQDVWRRDGHGR